MEYSSDVAILQSALLLADQMAGPGHLTSYQKGSSSLVLDILQEAVREILTLEGDKGSHEYHVQLRLVVGLLMKLLQKESSSAGSCLLSASDERFDAVTYGFPEISWDLFFDFVIGNNMWTEFCRVMPQLSKEAMTVVIIELLQYFERSPDAKEEVYLRNVVEFLCLTTYSPFFEVEENANQSSQTSKPVQPRRSDVLREPSEVLLNLVSEATTEPAMQKDVHRNNLARLADVVTSLHVLAGNESIAHSLACLAGNLLNTTGYALSPILCLDDPVNKNPKIVAEQHPLDFLCRLAKDMKILRGNSEKDVVDFMILLINENELPVRKVKIVLPAQSGESLLEASLQFLENVDLSKLNQGHRDPKSIGLFYQGRNEAVMGWVFQPSLNYILGQQCNHLESREDSQNKAKCLALLKMLRQDTQPETGDIMTKATFAVTYNIRGQRQYLKEVLEAEVRLWHNLTWLETLEQKFQILQDVDVFVATVGKLASMETAALPIEIVARYRTLVVKAFASGSLVLQNCCLDKLADDYSSDDLEEVFAVVDMESDIRSALNRTTSEVGLALELSKICLQSPGQLLQEITQTAKYNRGQITACVQILRQLPALMKYGLGATTAPVMLINELVGLIRKPQRSPREEQNILLLIRGLLEPHYSADRSETSVLCPADFVHQFVLPNAMITRSQPTNNDGVWCNLMLVCLEALTLHTDWSNLQAEVDPVLLLYVICLNLDREVSGNDEGRTVCLRDEWMKCVKLAKDLYGRFPDLSTDMDLLWLHGRVEGCHWTVVWICHDVVTSNPLLQKLPLPVPSVLLEVLDDPDKKLSGIVGLVDDPVMALFLFAGICDGTVSFIRNNLNRAAVDKINRLEERIVVCFALMLPTCPVDQWRRLVQCMELVTSASDKAPAQILHLVVSALWLVMDTKKVSTETWIDIASSLALTTTVIVLQNASLESLCHCFLLACNLMSNWPDTNFVENLLPLALDMITKLGIVSKESLGQDETPTRKEQLLATTHQWIRAVPLEYLQSHLDKAFLKECLDQ